jgi:hypothetical protein
MTEIETTLAGLFLALLHAIGSERAERATDMLAAFIADSRTGNYEKQFYRDLLDSIAMVNQPPALFDFDHLATLH